MKNSKIEALKAKLQAEIEKEESRKQKVAVRFLSVIEREIDNDPSLRESLSNILSRLSDKEKKLFSFIFGE